MKGRISTCILVLGAILIVISIGSVVVVGEGYHDGVRVGKLFFQMDHLNFALPIAFVLVILWLLHQRPDWITFLLILIIGWILFFGLNRNTFENEKVWHFSAGLVTFLLARSYLAHIDRLLQQTINVILIVFLMVISLMGGIVGILGELQVFNRYEIYHSIYKVTGTFFNPAPFAGYLIASLPYAVGLTLLPVEIKWHRAFSLIGWLSALVMFAILPATQSRAGWIGLLAAAVYFAYHQFSVREKIVEYYRLKKGMAVSIIATAFVLVCAGAYSAYQYKKDSADGRLLIWKVSIDMIQQKPWTGVGFNLFQAHYAPALANYFHEGKGSDGEKMLAGNVQWAFNEPLHFAIELGIPGAVLYLTLIFVALVMPVQEKWKQEDYRLVLLSARSALVAIFIFGLFSYPFYSPSITLLFFFSLAIIASALRVVRMKAISIVSKSAMLILLILIGFNTYGKTGERKQAYRLWKDGEFLYQLRSYEAANEIFKKALPVLKNQGQFLQQYGKSLLLAGDYDQAVEILNESGKFYKDDFWYLTLGDAHKQTGNFSGAEKHYKVAAQMVPHKLFPKFLLAMLYEEMNQPLKAKSVALNILTSEVKVMSPAVREIMSEMKELVNKTTLEKHEER